METSDSDTLSVNEMGQIPAGDSVSCGSVGGNVQASDSVRCGDVGGNVRASDSVQASAIGGDVNADSVRFTKDGKGFSFTTR